MIKISVPYLIAKAHSNHSKSPTAQQINAMVNAERMVDVEAVLQSTSYGFILEETRPSIDLQGFEVELRRNYAKMLNTYSGAATGAVGKLLKAYSLTVEAENMNLLLQAIIRDNVTEDLEKIIIPVGKFGLRHYQRILENTNVDVASDFIIYPKLRKAAQNALSQSTDPDERIFLLSSALSHTAFSILTKVAPKWVKLEVEFLNLETICRAINMGIDPDPWLISNFGTVYRKKHVLNGMNRPEDVLTYMLPHFPIPKVIQYALEADDPIVEFEDQASSYLYYNRYKSFLIYGMRNESVLDFFSIKRAEIEDISRILLSKIKRIPQAKVRKMLYPIYRRN